MLSHPQLPSHLCELLAEVEHLVGHPVRWERSCDLGGALSSDLSNGEPIIRYRKFTEAGAAEKLLHLEIVLSGVPRLSYPSNHGLLRQAATMLENLLHHHILYPVLEEWGYDPRR